MKTQFAGFNYPKKLVILKYKKPLNKKDYRKSVYYQDAAGVVQNNKDCEKSFYLESDFACRLRWAWCDELTKNIKHLGWFCDDSWHTTIRGIVFTLPRKRGFIIGYSMGIDMISLIDYRGIYEDEIGAAYAADSMAKYAAEKEWEYNILENKKQQIEENRELLSKLRKEIHDIIKELRTATLAPVLCDVVCSKLKSIKKQFDSTLAELIRLKSEVA